MDSNCPSLLPASPPQMPPPSQDPFPSAWGIGLPALPMRPPQQLQHLQMTGGGGGRGGKQRASSSRSPAQPRRPQSQKPAPPSAGEPFSQKSKESPLEPIRRPDGGGRLGYNTSIKLLVNHFLINFDENRIIYQYYVDMQLCSDDKKGAPRELRKSDKCLIKNKIFSHNPQIPHETCYDRGNNIYSPGTLTPPDTPRVFTVEVPEGDDTRSGSYQVTIKSVNDLDLSRLKSYIERNTPNILPRDVLQGMDLIMKENLSRNRVCVGRSFYSFSDGYDARTRDPGPPGGGGGRGGSPHHGGRGGPRGSPHRGGGGGSPHHGGGQGQASKLKAHRGLNQSVKVTSQGAALCVDYSILELREPMPLQEDSMTVIDFLTAYISGFSIDGFNSRRLEVDKALKGLLVKVIHRPTNQKYTIAGLTEENTCDISFERAPDPNDPTSREKIKLVDYFKKKWDRDIAHANIPCLELGKGNKSNKVPLELCCLIKGQKYPKKWLDKQTASRSPPQAPQPAQRFDNINKMVEAEYGGPHGGGIAKQFGLCVNPSMTEVFGRVIGAPRLKLKGSNTRQVNQDKGQWSLVENVELIDAKPITRWGLLGFGGNMQQLDDFVRLLKDRARPLGAQMESPLRGCVVVVPMQDLSSVEKLEGHLKDVIKKSGKEKLQLIVCAINDENKNHPGYKNLKWVAETQIGVVTQCFLHRKVPEEKRARDQYLANLLLKINAKLGGSNFEIDGKLDMNEVDEHVMFIGADVNHPSPGNTSSPSIAAVVGTVNWPGANQYATRFVPQKHRVERILKFGSMCMELVNTYKKFNKVWPSRIVVFRGGVSDGQFDMVLNQELQDLRKEVAGNGCDSSLRVTVIVAQKQHRTRLFVQNESGGGKGWGNVAPGTVVDTRIVNPQGFDFYLCSHYAQFGTSRPAHYHVLFDDNELGSDKLQKLIYDMCYTFGRCTKSVSLVPPVYYADLVAYRGRLFQEVVSERGQTDDDASLDESLYKIHHDIEDTMFFI